MKIKNTIVNYNDNNTYIADTYFGMDEFGDKARKLQYRELAISLIEKYGSASLRGCNDQRQIAERHIVGCLDMAFQYHKKYGACSAIDGEIKAIAVWLNIEFITIYNDPDISGFLKGDNNY